jgi:cysteinyl-tRNA synthetase
LRAIWLSLGAFLALFASKEAAAKPPRIQDVKSWGYQLQSREGARLDIGRLAASTFDLLVIDFADGDRPLTKSDVDRIRARPDKAERIMLAYLSVGEAEDYRFYWQPKWKSHPPSFIARANPDWKGNYKVRFWDPSWQQIVLGYIDRILDEGFDGAYLDIIDAFEFFQKGGEMPERASAAEDMRAFVEKIAAYARRSRKDFLIVPQNGSTIIDGTTDAELKAYFDAIDAIGAEDTFYADGERRTQKDVLAHLARFAKAGKTVLAVDYVSDPVQAKRFVELARKQSFVPYVGTRDLDRLVPQPQP